jgi:steroid delta-isomerase-like uncharacterized protein
MTPAEVVASELGAVDRQDPRALAAHFAEDCELVDLSEGTTVRGREALLEDLVELFEAVPDLHVASRRIVAAGNVVAAEIELAGTPVRPFMGCEPSGARFSWETCSFYEINEDGSIRRERMYYDKAALQRQLIGSDVSVVEMGDYDVAQ